MLCAFQKPARPLLTDDRFSERLDKSAIHNGFGHGHSGWGGQLIWADPVSDTVIAINSQLASELPAPFDHFNKLYRAAIDISKHYRKA
jgi:CubicO group peptidase (beta-lactamase class C family)